MPYDDYEEEKPWDLKDDFKFAPEKPEGDPWTLLGEPLFARDEKLCKILRDEVNNLLLFAGLFSAVITAFVVESKHNLQPDPNDDIISLLSQISAQLVNQANGNNQSSIPTAIPSTSFSPSQSSVRVNVYWFTSLIFSLTSVLVSIVALQWLRSHQTYTGLSPRDSLAVLNMRSESLHKWHVPTIIMSLPVLLEVSLLLFFMGLIDFLVSEIKSKPVYIFVSVAIGLSIFFLFVTTILPTVHTTLLRFRSSHPSHSLEKNLPPTQCPYKSPQSLLFHHVLSGIFRSLRMMKPWIQNLLQNLSRHFSFIQTIDKASSGLFSQHRALLHHLSTIYAQSTWTDIDLAWLGVRDAAQHSADYSEPDMEEYDQFLVTERSLPLYDIVESYQRATSADYTHAFGSALYHCFYELSYATVMTSAMKRFRLRIFRADNRWDLISQNVLERNRYFQSLISIKEEESPLQAFIQGATNRTPTDFIDFGPPKYLHMLVSNIQILHHQNILLHMDNLKRNDRYSKIMSNHRKEIMLRLAKAIYQRDLALREGTFSLPPYLRGKIFDQGLSILYSDPNTVSLFHQHSCMVSDFFIHAASTPVNRLNDTSLATHSDIPEFLENASWDMYRNIVAFSLPRTAPHDHVRMANAFNKVVDLLIERLRQPIEESATLREKLSQPSRTYFLFTSAIYARRLSAFIGYGNSTYKQGFKFPQEVLDKLDVLLHELALYKTKVLNFSEKEDISAISTAFLEKRFRGIDRYGSIWRFSEEWWSFLDKRAGYYGPTLERSRSPWFEDSFFDQLRRITSNTLTYTSPGIIAVQNAALDPASDAPPGEARANDSIGTGSYTLQLVPVSGEMEPPANENYERREGD